MTQACSCLFTQVNLDLSLQVFCPSWLVILGNCKHEPFELFIELSDLPVIIFCVFVIPRVFNFRNEKGIWTGDHVPNTYCNKNVYDCDRR